MDGFNPDNPKYFSHLIFNLINNLCSIFTYMKVVINSDRTKPRPGSPVKKKKYNLE